MIQAPPPPPAIVGRDRKSWCLENVFEIRKKKWQRKIKFRTALVVRQYIEVCENS
jgi:hypothetical protein